MAFALTAIIITTLTQVGLTILLIIKSNTMAKTQAEVAAELVALKGQVEKFKGEVSAKLQALADALASQGNASPEVEAALADLKVTVQSADDLIPDAEPTPDPEV